jgi:hypothetical protein
MVPIAQARLERPLSISRIDWKGELAMETENSRQHYQRKRRFHRNEEIFHGIKEAREGIEKLQSLKPPPNVLKYRRRP